MSEFIPRIFIISNICLYMTKISYWKQMSVIYILLIKEYKAISNKIFRNEIKQYTNGLHTYSFEHWSIYFKQILHDANYYAWHLHFIRIKVVQQKKNVFFFVFCFCFILFIYLFIYLFFFLGGYSFYRFVDVLA